MDLGPGAAAADFPLLELGPPFLEAGPGLETLDGPAFGETLEEEGALEVESGAFLGGGGGGDPSSSESVSSKSS